MSTHQSKTWLVGYDIRQPRRLRRVHRFMRKQGLAAQYSAFTVEADDVQVQAMLLGLQVIIDPRQDDVRAYHLSERCPVWRLGNQGWPDGIYLAPAQAARLLLATTDEASDDNLADAVEPG